MVQRVRIQDVLERRGRAVCYSRVRSGKVEENSQEQSPESMRAILWDLEWVALVEAATYE
jgi:hypothetical protein